MAKPDGIHAIYKIEPASLGAGAAPVMGRPLVDPVSVALFTSEIEAHRARGTDRTYVYWPYGMTLQEAIDRSPDADKPSPRATAKKPTGLSDLGPLAS